MGASLLAAATSGSLAAVLTLPFDVIKTQQQAALGQAVAAGVPVRRSDGTVAMIRVRPSSLPLSTLL